MEKPILEPVYFRLIDENGGISFIIAHHKGKPENPRLLFDGQSTAVLYRRSGQTIALAKLDKEVTAALKQISSVIFTEPKDDGSSASVKEALDLGQLTYQVPVQQVKRLPVAVETLIADNSANPFAGKSDEEIARIINQVQEMMES